TQLRQLRKMFSSNAHLVDNRDRRARQTLNHCLRPGLRILDPFMLDRRRAEIDRYRLTFEVNDANAHAFLPFDLLHAATATRHLTYYNRRTRLEASPPFGYPQSISLGEIQTQRYTQPLHHDMRLSPT